MLTLYDFGNSVCCQKVRITLLEKGLTWEARKVDLFKTEQYDPEYLKLNPKGVVPTLVHDGTPIIESTLICEYLDDTFPDPPLVPKDPAERARMRLWSKFVDEGLFDGVTELSFSAMFRERMRTMSPELREKRFRNVGDPRRTDRFKSTYEHGVYSPFVLHAIAAYERAFKLGHLTCKERCTSPHAARILSSLAVGCFDYGRIGRAREQGISFRGEARADPLEEAALSNLLNIIGRRDGARSVISIG